MAYTSLLFDISDHVAYVTLNRPEAANTLDAIVALGSFTTLCSARSETRVFTQSCSQAQDPCSAAAVISRRSPSREKLSLPT